MKGTGLVLGLIVAGGLAVGVYRAKLGAQETEASLRALETEIAEVTQDIAVLRAEEAYLSRPERIGPLARERLGLQPAGPDQFAHPDGLGARLLAAPASSPAEDAGAAGRREAAERAPAP